MDDAGRDQGSAKLTALPTARAREGAENAPAERPRLAEKTAIVVLGMHRSGTSALARVLNLLGCDLPKTLMGSGVGNELGHWESDSIRAFNDALLESAGSCWDDWLSINPGWRRSPKAEEFRAKARDLLAQEFGASSLFVLKDPRICRLASFWLDVLDGAGIEPALIIPVRNPLEVAASLASRDGFDPELGHLIWLRHVLDAEAASRGRPRFHCSYDELLASWRRTIENAQGTLDLSFPRLTARVEEEVGAFLGQRHRHHREARESVVENAALSDWLRDAFAVLDRWTESGEAADDYAALDRVRSEFDAAAPAFAKIVLSGQRAAARGRKLEEALSRLAAERDATASELMQTRGRLVETEAKAAEEGQRLAVASVESERLRCTIERVKTELTAKEAASASLVEAHTALVQALDGAHRRLSEAQSRLNNAELKVQRLEAEAAEKEAVLSRMAAERSALARSVDAIEAEAAECALNFGRLAGLDSERLQACEHELAATREELSRTTARLGERFREIATLTRLLQDKENAARAAANNVCEAQRTARTAADEAEWLRCIAAALLVGGERWRGRLFQLLPGFIIRAWVMRHLRRQGLFDGEAYLRAHPDVAQSGLNPLRHYVHFGIKEGRARG